jgi:hypothetical protein
MKAANKICMMISAILVVGTTLLNAQEVGSKNNDSAFVLMRTYEGDIAGAALDRLDNLYIISSKGQVKKFGAAGDSLSVYNQVRNYGQLYTLDVTNPLKLLLFYKDFKTVVVLDRFLSTMKTVDLRRYNILQPIAIGLSYDNNVWVFDEYDNKLKKIDEQGNHLFESNDFRSVFNQGISPQKIIDDNGLVYLADSSSGVFVFDNYGSFKKKIPLHSFQSIAVNRNQVVSTRPDLVTVYNTSTLLQTERKPPFAPYVLAFTSADRFVGLMPGKLAVYQYRYGW